MVTGGVVDDQEDPPVDEEADELEESCNMFQNFMHELNKRGTEGLSERSRGAILKIKKSMANFLTEHDKVKDSKKEMQWDYFGAPKIDKEIEMEKKKELHAKGDSKCSKMKKKGLNRKTKKSGKSRSSSSSCVYDADSSSSSESENSISSSSDRSSQKKTRKSKKVSIGKFLSQMDFRSVLQMAPYQEKSGQDL